jgi:hypothetical protein
MNGPTKRKKTIIRSFRISEGSFKVLQEEAAQLNVSINTLVDQIIGVHTSYERFMKKFGMMRMAQSTFRRLLEILPKDRIAQAVRQPCINLPLTEAKKLFFFFYRNKLTEEILFPFCMKQKTTLFTEII